MSSAATSSTDILSVTSGETVAKTPEGALNPNAAAFDSFSYMTLSDTETAAEVLKETEKKWQNEDVKELQSNLPETTSPSSRMQYSPELTNGYDGPEVFSNQSLAVHEQSSSPEAQESLPAHELKSLIRRQLEYYFSRENLAVDSYLMSQMDEDQYVPIWTVANFNQIKKLTSNLALVKEAIKDSPNLQLDDSGDKLRANVKRCIVILREIPESTPIEEVQGLFSGENCPKWTSCEFAHNNYWYITFESDQDAQKAYRYLREEVKTFKGKPIMARIKAKPMHSSNYLPKNGFRQQAPVETQQQPHQTQQQQPQQQQQTQTMPFNQPRHFQFPPVAQVYNGQTPFQYFPAPGMMHTWPPGQIFAEAPMPQNFPTNGFVPGIKPVQAQNPVRGYQGNRTRFSGKNNYHRDQSQLQQERSDRESQQQLNQSRQRPHSTNGNISINSATSTAMTTTTTTTSSSNSSSNNSTSFRSNRMVRPSEDDHRPFNRGSRQRRRRGSSEDISRHTRQQANRASPVRHSKDDSDTLVFEPSHFPPLPTSPASTLTRHSTKDVSDNKVLQPPQSPDGTESNSPSSPLPSPTSWSKPLTSGVAAGTATVVTRSSSGSTSSPGSSVMENSTKQLCSPPTSTSLTSTSPSVKASINQINSNQTEIKNEEDQKPAERLSYAQITQKTPPKTQTPTTPTKSPTK